MVNVTRRYAFDAIAAFGRAAAFVAVIACAVAFRAAGSAALDNPFNLGLGHAHIVANASLTGQLEVVIGSGESQSTEFSRDTHSVSGF